MPRYRDVLVFKYLSVKIKTVLSRPDPNVHLLIILAELAKMPVGVCLTVDFSPIANAHNQNAELPVFDVGDDSIVANPVLPELAKP